MIQTPPRACSRPNRAPILRQVAIFVAVLGGGQSVLSLPRAFADEAPATVTDLQAVATATGGAKLRWTAPGDDGPTGRASVYEMHIATFPIDAGNVLVTPSIAAPVPGSAGSPDSLQIDGLLGGYVYYFALRSIDDHGNVSELSNVASVDLDERVPPATIEDLRAMRAGFRSFELQWTAPGDDGMEGRAARYTVEQITGDQPSVTLPGPDPGLAGSTERLIVTVSEGVTESFDVRTLDDVGNVSARSNVVQVVLPAIRPASVSDLHLIVPGDSSLALGWTATGDDSLDGIAPSYEVRAADHPFDARTFEAAPLRWVVESRFQPGELVLATFSVPRPGFYWFALRAVDPAGGASEISNVITARTEVSSLSSRIHLAPMANPSRLPVSLAWQSVPTVASTPQSIRIHDLSGRVLRTFDLGHAFGGVVVWDGSDEHGQRAPAGLYFARLKSGPRHSQTRLVLLP